MFAVFVGIAVFILVATGLLSIYALFDNYEEIRLFDNLAGIDNDREAK